MVHVRLSEWFTLHDIFFSSQMYETDLGKTSMPESKSRLIGLLKTHVVSVMVIKVTNFS